MNSEQIFSYSEYFLKEIIDSLLKLKILKQANVYNDLNSKLRSLMGKSFDEGEFSDLISAKDKEFKDRIFNNLTKIEKKELKFR